jgi:hydrogenase maturation protein HypF
LVTLNKVGETTGVRVEVSGVVQGVGFRPFVYRLARKYHLAGWVRNTSSKVEIEVEGPLGAIQNFLKDLRNQAPPQARVERVLDSDHEFQGYIDFVIRGSVSLAGEYQLVSPDIAVCQDCQRELFDPRDRRYHYPFINCTNCGPRFTIIEDIPYDRPRTTMRRFEMCPECQEEYDNPLDRRFHAQPNACPVCGPSLNLVDAEGRKIPGDEIEVTVSLLREGKIVAIKGLGGFLLACDATNREAVALLRQRKRRPFKPLAVMMSTTEQVREHCEVSGEEEELLLSPQSPIVLLRWKQASSSVVEEVAPNLRYLGVMLPYTPLHHLLMRRVGCPLVMTSGNLSEEPIAKDNDEATRRLSGIADYFLVHNRDIHSCYDDSVFAVEGGTPRAIRRARGYAPFPIHLPFSSQQVLACGAEQKNTFCLAKEGYAFLSQHIGDLENEQTLDHFETTIELYKELFRVQPEIVAYDMHPEYLSTKYALDLKARQGSRLRWVPVQHHHAHIASCLAENGTLDRVIGVALDGTGYGPDGAIWGGEFLVADARSYERYGHIEYVPMPGGATAILKPYRMALGYLSALLPGEASLNRLPLLSQVSAEELVVIQRQIERRINAPLTSSCGRLFDAVAAIAGIRGEIDYDAQAAIELEMLAPEGVTLSSYPSYPYSIQPEGRKRVIRVGQLLAAIVRDVEKGTEMPLLSAKFHITMALMISDMCSLIAQKTGLRVVALSGGVFQNRLLFRLAVAALESKGFEVLSHRLVPTNDGAIALGQAVIAHFLTADRQRSAH